MAVFRRRAGRPAPVGPQRQRRAAAAELLASRGMPRTVGEEGRRSRCGPEVRPAPDQPAERPFGRLGTVVPGEHDADRQHPRQNPARPTRYAPHNTQGEPSRTGHLRFHIEIICAQAWSTEQKEALERAAEIFGLVDGPAIAGINRTEGIMMAKYKRKKPQNVADRLRWLAPHVEDFQACLGQKGYSAATITEVARLLACWAEWVRDAGFDIGPIGTGFAASAEIFRGSKTAPGAAGRGRVVHRLSPTERACAHLRCRRRARRKPWPILGRVPKLDA